MKEQKRLNANSALDKLFNTISPMNKDSQWVSVEVDNCILFIPLDNLDESKVEEFRERFKTVYDMTKVKKD